MAAASRSAPRRKTQCTKATRLQIRVGIPSDEVYHIFDRFHHLESDGDHTFGGVGLGLPIAKQVVEQHGGRISVVSRVGRGSTFTVTLPGFLKKP